jgi:adenylate kinase
MSATPFAMERRSGTGGGSPSLVVVLGPPGSGKGTQCARLAATLGLAHVSTGDALREEARRGTRLGNLASRHLDSGGLVPDHLVIGAVTTALARCRRFPGVLLDGFPRTEAQAVALDELGAGAVRLAAALVVSRAVLLERLRNRGRTDDRSDIVRRRLIAYEVETRPLLDFYARNGMLVHVDGNRSPTEVTTTLAAHLAAVGIVPMRYPTPGGRPRATVSSVEKSNSWTTS